MRKIICIDIDNTLCKTFKNRYSKSTPYKKIIKKVNSLYEQGHYIKIFTSRYMGRNKENVSKVKKIGYASTYKQLISWNLKFNELIMGKPSFDILIDDKSIYFKKDWTKQLDLKLKKISKKR